MLSFFCFLAGLGAGFIYGLFVSEDNPLLPVRFVEFFRDLADKIRK